MDTAHGLLIGGEERGGADDPIEIVNPATGESFTDVAAASSEDVDTAVTDAADATTEWGSLDPAARGRHLSELATAIRADKDRLARIETEDTGKPVPQIGRASCRERVYCEV